MNRQVRRWRSSRKFFISLAALTLVASAVLYAEFNAGYYSPNSTGEIRQTLSVAPLSGATYDAGVYPLFPPSLPAGTGRDDVASYCNTCHSARYITMQPPLAAQTWADEVHKMTGAYGASIPADATQRIIGYLQTNFSVGNRKQ